MCLRKYIPCALRTQNILDKVSILFITVFFHNVSTYMKNQIAIKQQPPTKRGIWDDKTSSLFANKYQKIYIP